MKRLSLWLGAIFAVLLVSAAPAFATATAPTATIEPATGITTTGATLNATVNAGANALVVSCTFNYGPTTGYGQSAACSPTPSTTGDTSVSATVTGLNAGTGYDYDVVLTVVPLLPNTTPSATSANATFTTTSTGGKPTATTGAASNVFSTTATLNGTVDNGGSTLTGCQFLYGTSASALNSTANCSSTPTGSGAQPVSADINGLTPSTQYYFELKATNANGSSTGAPQTFTTTATTPPPTASNPQSSNVTSSSATVSATVNPQGVQVTSCVFDYGTSSSYGASVPCSPTPSGSSDQTVNGDLTGLSPNTKYHFQVVLTTAGGSASTPDATFTTAVAGTASTGQPSQVRATTATVTGTVNPQGQTVQSCAFYYGLASGGYQGSVPCSPMPTTGTSDEAVSGSLTSLKPGTAYHYILVLTSTGGTVVGAPAVTFTTLLEPTGFTGGASGVTISAATLHGSVNPHGAPVIACVFEYGVTPFTDASSNQYSKTIPCSPKPSGSSNVPVSATLTHLAAHTKYYYRVLMSTQGGVLVGSTGAFTTHAKPKKKLPGVRLRLSQVAPKFGAARFYFRGTGTHATRFECALVKGRGAVHFRSCRSGVVYFHLHRGAYRFVVRAGNRYGYGRPATHRFKIIG